MLVEDIEIPAISIPVAVSLLGPPRLAGKIGIAWIDWTSEDIEEWYLVIPGMPSVIHCHCDLLVPLPESARPVLT